MSGTTASDTDDTPTWIEKVEKLGAAGVTFLVFFMLGAAMVLSAVWDMSSNQTFTSIVETLKALALLCAGFWVGNSKSGQDSTGTLSTIAKQSTSAPPASAELISALKDNTTATQQAATAATNGNNQGTNP